MPRPRRWVALATAVTVLALAGCASAEDEPEAQDPETSQTSEPTGSSDTSESPEPTGTVIDITVTGDSVDPNGERVEAKVGEPITLNIDAESAGELHVHATPEQEIAYEAGKSTHELTIDQPGVVDVESHDLELIVVQLQVS